MKTLLALLLLTSAANAIELPPAHFERPAAGVRITELPRSQVHKACKAYFGWLAEGMGRIEGCADPVARIIIMPVQGSVSPLKWGCIYRHELGHINGWPTDHPGGRQEAGC